MGLICLGIVCFCWVWVCVFVGEWVCFGHFFVSYMFVFVEYLGLCWVQICFLLCTCVFCLATHVLVGYGLVFVG